MYYPLISMLLSDSINKYVGGYFYFPAHKNRAISFNEALKKTSTPMQLSSLIKSQMALFDKPMTKVIAHKNAKKHELPLKNVTYDEYYQIMARASRRVP